MNKIITSSLTLLAAVITCNAFAQALPATDVWLTGIEAGVPVNPIKISKGVGYNNQPHFSADGAVIYYTREMPGKEGVSQTDVAAFSLKISTTTMVNNTPESEYSPTPVPGRNAVSVIQADLEQKQLLWAIDVTNGNMDLLFPNVEPVGYHAWFSDDEVAMFILGDSFTLQTAKLNHDGTRVVADNIGRSIRKHPKTGEVLFVDKNQNPWQVAAFDPVTLSITTVMPLFPGSEDFTIDDKGNYWTGNGSKLYQRSPGDNRWKLMADFRMFGIKQISRLAIHIESGKLALVSNHVVTN
jgi:hypothetical protein